MVYFGERITQQGIRMTIEKIIVGISTEAEWGRPPRQNYMVMTKGNLQGETINMKGDKGDGTMGGHDDELGT